MDISWSFSFLISCNTFHLFACQSMFFFISFDGNTPSFNARNWDRRLVKSSWLRMRWRLVDFECCRMLWCMVWCFLWKWCHGSYFKDLTFQVDLLRNPVAVTVGSFEDLVFGTVFPANPLVTQLQNKSAGIAGLYWPPHYLWLNFWWSIELRWCQHNRQQRWQKQSFHLNSGLPYHGLLGHRNYMVIISIHGWKS